MDQLAGQRARRCALWATMCMLLGCGTKPAFEFDRFDLLPVEEELTEFSLGEYKIPIPVADAREGNGEVRRNRLQFDFDLYALVSPTAEAQFASAWQRHEGVLRDQVIRICRSASVAELQEPELSTLKARITDVLASHLGGQRLRQLLITDIVSQEL